MSQCSKELDPIFDQIAENAIAKDRAEYGSAEWRKYEDKSRKLYLQARSIFLHYNPEDKPENKSRRKGRI